MYTTQIVHTVTISVTPAGFIQCSPDPLPVRGRDATLTFLLETAGYRFPINRAVMVKAAPNAQFPFPAQTRDARTVTLYDANTDDLLYPYTVRVISLEDERLIERDPSIENGK